MAFLLLTRELGDLKRPVALNLSHVIACYPAVDFNLSGNCTPADGCDIWTTLEAASENVSPWRVVESYDDVSKQVSRLLATGAQS